MEAQQEWHFTSPDQFWAELDELISVPPDSNLDDLDYALRNYIAFASTFMDEFLTEPGALDHALLALLSSPLFTSHVDRMTGNIISSISHPRASSSTLFISLMLVLHLGEGANPLTTAGVWADPRKAGAGVTVGSSKVFRLMRKRWKEVVPVLMNRVWHAGVVHEVHPEAEDQDAAARGEALVGMPADGWEERVGTAATAVLYELCRVQKLGPEELTDFTFDFIARLFSLVERTRDVEDETFNYSLIKLIIALNEQFMISTVPAERDSGASKLPPPILPTVVGGKVKRERGHNTVLEVLREKEHESKTFGENIIFILNRADGTPDSLCVSLLILKILYLLFTTSGTQEFFYTNDLCVLVDVFIRELYNLDEESEGLKHTYLRVLHPLLTNTQLRQHPYKRPELRRCLESLVANSHYRACDPTTRRLVERNLRASWCQSLRSAENALSGLMCGSKSATASTLSVDAVATTGEEGGDGSQRARDGSRQKKGARRRTSVDDYSVSYGAPSVVAQGHELLNPVAERTADGQIPEAVRTSFRLTEDRMPRAHSGTETSWTGSPQEEHAPHAFHLPDQDVPTSVSSISAGHELLHPVAVRHRGSSPTHPLLSGPSSVSPMVTPRPRSHSLHASHTAHEYHHYRPAPPPPAPSAPQGEASDSFPLQPDGSVSSPSSRSSSSHHVHGTHHASPPSWHPAHHHSHAPVLPGSACAGSAPTAARRRRPPPPPSQQDGGSRPRTPSDAPPSPGYGPGPAGTGVRRRPPPPPGAGASNPGGRGSPRAGSGREERDREDDMARAVQALAVA